MYRSMYSVDLNSWVCSCRRWELTGIPCSHVVTAVWHNKQQPELYVSKWYTKEFYMKAYSHQIFPLRNQEEWPRSGKIGMQSPINKKTARQRKSNQGIPELMKETTILHLKLPLVLQPNKEVHKKLMNNFRLGFEVVFSSFLIEFVAELVEEALKKRNGDSSCQTPSTKRSQGGEAPSKEKLPAGETSLIAAVLSSEAKKGKDMLQYYLDRSLPEVSNQLSGADNEFSLQLVMDGVLKEVARLLAANNWVKELMKEIQEMASTAHLEADNEALLKEVNALKDERESLRTLLSKLEEDIKTRQTREEELLKEVESLEKAALEVFYKFWKANPSGNFDYLRDSKEAYLNSYVGQAAKENLEAANSRVPTDQSTETLAVQNVEPPTPTDQVDPYKELGTPPV
uniref:SWIM-type domain-containing protein n=1 Tax=Cannabis sativa TaxID=3483 RepID=A0A803NI84_CANSA